MANAFVVQSLAMLLVSANLLLTPSSAKMFIIIMLPSSSDSFFPPKVNPVVSPPTPNNPESVTIFISTQGQRFWVSQVVLVVKNPPPNARDVRDTDLIPGSKRSPGGGHGNPLHYSCLENPMDKGDWQATVHRVTENRTRLKRLSTHACTEVLFFTSVGKFL